jgi:hypothetical protein
MCLENRAAINAFRTYLDAKAQAALTESGALDAATWDLFKDAAIKALSPPLARVQARFEIKKATQGHDETVAQFGQRLLDLGKAGYTQTEAVARDSALKDALSGGVIRDDLAIHLINMADRSFAEMLDEATRMDASHLARQALKEDGKYSVAVMNTQVEREPERQISREVNQVSFDNQFSNPQRNPTSVTCFKCFRQGHYANQCTFGSYDPRLANPLNNQGAQNYSNNAHVGSQVRGTPLRCFYCGKLGHTIRQCRFRLRVEQAAYAEQQNYPGNQHGVQSFNPNHQAMNQGFYTGKGQNPVTNQQQMSGIQKRGPLEDRAVLAYNAALQRQANRHSASSGQINSAVAGPASGLGFEQYDDQWSPAKLIERNPTQSQNGKTSSTIPKN